MWRTKPVLRQRTEEEIEKEMEKERTVVVPHAVVLVVVNQLEVGCERIGNATEI